MAIDNCITGAGLSGETSVRLINKYNTFLANGLTKKEAALEAIKQEALDELAEYNDVVEVIREDNGFALAKTYDDVFKVLVDDPRGPLPNVEPEGLSFAQAEQAVKDRELTDKLSLTGAIFDLSAQGLTPAQIATQIARVNRWTDVTPERIRGVQVTLDIPSAKLDPEAFAEWQDSVSSRSFELNSHLLINGLNPANISFENKESSYIGKIEELRNLLAPAKVKLLTPFSYIKDFFKSITPEYFTNNNISTEEQRVFNAYKRFHDSYFNNFKFQNIEFLVNGRGKETKFVKNNDVIASDVITNPIELLFTLTNDKNNPVALDENLKGIISFATFKWLFEEYRSIWNRNDSDIKAAFDLSDSDFIKGEVLEFLSTAGDLKSNAARNIGKNVLEMLGIGINKQLSDEIDPHFKEQLTNSLGLVALNNLISPQTNTVPMLVEVPMTAADKQTMLGQDVDAGKENVNFIRFNEDTKETNFDKYREFFEGNKDLVKSFFSKFAVGYEKTVVPKLKPTPLEAQTKIRKGTGQPLTEVTTEVINKLSNLAFGLDRQVHKVLSGISKEDYLESMGYVPDVDSKDSTIMNIRRSSVRGSNLTLEMAYDNYMAYTEALIDLDTPTFFDWFVSSNNRLNMSNNGVNPQSEKLHRHGYKPVSQLNTVVPKGPSETRNNFIRAVAHAFGYEIDKVSFEQAKDFVETMNKDPRIIRLRKLQGYSRKLTEAEAKEQSLLIKDIVTSFYNPLSEKNDSIKTTTAEASHFDGLAALIAYKPRAEFTTSITIETDSTSSGVSLGSMVLTTAYDRRLLAAAGVHTDGTTDQVEWKSNPDNFDNYEQTSKTLSDTLTNPENDYNQDLISALKGFLPDLVETLADGIETVGSAGRKFAKNPVTILMYGAGLKKVLENKGYALIDSIYEKIQEAIDNDHDPAMVQAIEDSINAIFAQNPFKELAAQKERAGEDVPAWLAKLAKNGVNKFKFKNPKNLIGFQFHPFETFTLRTAFDVTYGSALRSTIESLFQDILDVRNNLLAVIGDTFDMYKVAYDAEVKRYTEQKYQTLKKTNPKLLIENTPLNSDDYAAIEKAVAVFAPSFKTILSKGREDGVLALKKGKETVEAYPAQVRYAKGQKQNVRGQYKIHPDTKLPYWDENAKSVKTTDKIASTREVPAQPGAFGMTSLIQDLESSVMQTLILAIDGILGVHDATTIGIDGTVAVPRQHNEQFAEMTNLANIIGEVVNTHKIVSKEFAKQGFSLPERTESAQEKIDTAIQMLPIAAADNRAMRDQLYQKENTTISNVYFPEGHHTVNSEELFTNIDEFIKELEKDIETQSDPKNLGSQPNQSHFNPSQTETLTRDNTVKQFDQLASKGNKTDNPNHTAHLRSIISDIANNVMTASEQLILNLQEDGAATWGRIQGKVIDLNIAIDPAMTSLAMSAQEVFVHEHVHNITTYAMENNPFLRSQVRKLFKAARDQLTVKDFMVRTNPNDLTSPYKIVTDQATEEAAAQARYDYIFNSPNGIYEFIAFGNTNEQFRNRLASVQVTKTRENPSGTIEGWIASWFEQAVRFVTNMFYKISNRNAADQLAILTQRMSKINDKNNAIGKSFTKLVDMGNPYLTKAAVSFVFKPLEKYSKKKNPNVVSKGLNVGFKLYYDTTTRKHFANIAKQTVKRFDDMTHGYLSPILNILKHLPKEMAGLTEANKKFYYLLRKSKHFVDQASQKELESVYNTLNEAYLTGYSEDESTAILRSLIQTDLIDLTGKYRPADIERLFSNDDYLAAEISKTLLELDKFGPNKNQYAKQAKSLGSIMATGVATAYNSMLNPHNIARGYYDKQFKAFGNLNDAEQILSRLKSLYAIKYTDVSHKANFLNVYKREYGADSVRNGIVITMEMLKHHREESLDRLFNGSKAMMQSGYHSQVLDPNVGIKFSTNPNDTDLIKAGYKKVETLSKDNNFKAGPKDTYMYVSNHGGLSTYTKTIVSLTANRVQGTSLTDIATLQLSPNPANTAKQYADDVRASTEALIAKNQDPKNNEALLIPVVDPSGDIVNYRYIMTEANRSTYLHKDTRFDYVMGSMYAARLNKINSSAINSETVQALYDDYKANYSKNPDSFVFIGPDLDGELGEHWALLPYEFRQEINDKFNLKDKGFYIQEEYIDLVLGQRKLSLANAALLRNKAGIVKTAESIMQDIVSLVKSNIVIKSTVLINNVISNFLVGFLHGVPMRYMAAKKAEATKALDDYIKAEREKRKLELQVKGKSLTPAQRKAMIGKINQLQSDIDDSVVKPLIDEGLFASIVEDLDVQTAYDKFNTQAKISSWFEEKIGKRTPEMVRKAYGYAYLTKENPVFQFLNKTTQYSDFVARYAVYSHLTKEQKKSHEEALVDVIRSFVNYDAPTSKELQWLNDHGFAAFTKYAIRIQKPLWMLMQGRPTNAISLGLLQTMLGVDIPDIYDSFSFTPGLSRITDPISLGIGGMGLWGLTLIPNQLDAIDAVIP